MHTKARKTAALFLILSVATSALAAFMTPDQFLVEANGRLHLENQIPKSFGEWRQDETVLGAVVNPQQQAVIDAIYSETLSRTYVNRTGQRIMLSVAYGDDQRDGLQVHKPEVCYPAQGFQLNAVHKDHFLFEGVSLPVKRVETVLGAQRYEPVTYWIMVGEVPVLGGTDKKVAEMKYGFRGLVPDGLLFRVSMINRDSASAYAIEDQFLRDMIPHLDSSVLGRYFGNEIARATHPESLAGH